jgi:hypothetical protein
MSALDLLGLSDVVPEVHLMVPRSKRYRTGTVGAAIHTTTRRIDKSDVHVREGIRVTGPVRSIVDSPEAGTAPEHIEVAVRQALDRGIATGPTLLRAAKKRSGRVERFIRQTLQAPRQ